MVGVLAIARIGQTVNVRVSFGEDTAALLLPISPRSCWDPWLLWDLQAKKRADERTRTDDLEPLYE